jgi:DNA-binding CsgD family transcriptional regulator
VVLRGRRRESAVFDRLLEGVRSGHSGVLVVRGEAGVGKTALLESALASAADLRVVRAVGVESETELAFAALHQLCAPLLDRSAGLPAPQREALEIVFGLSGGPVPDRFLVGLGVLSLFSEVAAERALVCVVDDAQWLDQASALTLAFLARRLFADRVALVFATREPGEELRGLPELEVLGLHNGDARALLSSVVPWRLDEGMREAILAETRGNPLALLELPRGLSQTQLAGGFGVTSGLSLSARIEDSFLRQLESLPEETQRLMLVAAAEPVGDPTLLWGAAERLGVSYDALTPAASAGLLEAGSRVRFRHPLVRSGVYRAASLSERRRVHAALAQVTDPEVDPDRRAWHRAQAAAGPDEEVAQELERSAGRAQARGGLAAAAAFLERAAALSVDPALRAERMLAAAHVHVQAGASEAALALLAAVQTGELDELERVRVDLLRGQIAFGPGVGGDASGLLLNAAERLEPLDLKLARETYLDAWGAALFAGRLAGTGRLLEVSTAARSAPAHEHPTLASDLLLDGMAGLITDGREAAAPMLRAAVSAFVGAEATVEESLRWGYLGQAAALVLWDEASWHAISVRHVQLDRDAGALARLPIDLISLAMSSAWFGEFDTTALLIEESEVVAEATGIQIAPFGAMSLAALRGRESEALAIVDATITGATAAGQGVAVQYANWVAAMLANSLGRYEEALVPARLASDDTPELYVSGWAMVELIEAAARSGQTQLATEGVERLVASTQPAGTDWALAIEARSRALISEATTADALYREAIDRFSRTRLRTELARAHLLYGEWLRRQTRRVDAREQLRTAHGMFDAIGMEAFARRAEHELSATGERPRKRTVATRDDLTPQELQIAQMARDGLTNPEIGTRVFLSPRTVEWHLGKIFAKLEISTRNHLVHALPSRASETPVI